MLVLSTLEIIAHFDPLMWVIENPATGLLKTRPFMERLRDLLQVRNSVQEAQRHLGHALGGKAGNEAVRPKRLHLFTVAQLRPPPVPRPGARPARSAAGAPGGARPPSAGSRRPGAAAPPAPACLASC